MMKFRIDNPPENHPLNLETSPKLINFLGASPLTSHSFGLCMGVSSARVPLPRASENSFQWKQKQVTSGSRGDNPSCAINKDTMFIKSKQRPVLAIIGGAVVRRSDSH